MNTLKVSRVQQKLAEAESKLKGGAGAKEKSPRTPRDAKKGKKKETDAEEIAKRREALKEAKRLEKQVRQVRISLIIRTRRVHWLFVVRISYVARPFISDSETLGGSKAPRGRVEDERT